METLYYFFLQSYLPFMCARGKSNVVHAPKIDEPLGFFLTSFFAFVFWTAVLHNTGARAVQHLH